MIPVRLTLKNFMSYGEEGETLPFEGLHVACLSGDNGNGKSALLDAITWALWGKTRASSVKSVTEDDLIRYGANEVEVRFEFDLNGQRYRVVRKRRRGRSGSDWQLAQVDAAGNYVPIGGNSQRETERHIVQLLSMEYETFLNSAYLQQGRADEFTRQTPDNRKRILAEILGLGRYERLEAMAKELTREKKSLADDLEGQINLLEAEMRQLPEYEERLKRVRDELAVVEERIGIQERKTALLLERRARLETQHQNLLDREASQQRLEADITQRDRELCEKQSRLKGLQEILAQRESILQDYAALQRARERREKLEPEVEAFNQANRELQNTIGAIDIERTRLLGEAARLEDRLSALMEREKELGPLVRRIAQMSEELKAEAELPALWDAAQAELQESQEAFSELVAKNERLKTELAELDEVLELLRRPQAACPVCGNDLEGDKRKSVLRKQEARRERLSGEAEAVKREGTARKQARTQAQHRVNELTARRDALNRLRAQLQQAVERSDSLKAETAGIAEARKQAEALRKQVETESFAEPKRQRRRLLEQNLERLTLVKAEYEAVTIQFRRLEPTSHRYQQLLTAEGSRERDVLEKERLETLLKEKRLQWEQAKAQIDELRKQLGEYHDLQQQAREAEAVLKTMRQEAETLRTEVGRFTGYIARCEQAREQRQVRAAEHKRLDEERKIYHALSAAFGKKGIQTLIIENTLPELEEEANELLARITDNGMQVRFNAVRLARSSGSDIETLDIVITDDVGTRPYELFSGGEAFRINFAIRIALSRLLARRSGARLQTLILDEGFGSQDGKGREKLLEVIEVIKEDFEKILVITHFEEMKDSFPQRIEVTKGVDGSRIHLL